MTLNLAFRIWVDGLLRFEETQAVEEDQLGEVLPKLAEKHAALIRDRLHMIEIEFLDEPNLKARFFRFGTDWRRMVAPLRLADLSDDDADQPVSRGIELLMKRTKPN